MNYDAWKLDNTEPGDLVAQCPECNDWGDYEDNDISVYCPLCKGTGEITQAQVDAIAEREAALVRCEERKDD